MHSGLFFRSPRTISSLFLRLSGKPVLVYWENAGLSIFKKNPSHIKVLYDIIKWCFYMLEYMSPALVMCDHQRVNILSCRRSTFCLPERVGSKGLSRVKVWVTFAKGPSSPSANRSWKAAVKPAAAAKAGLALIPCPWRTDFIYSGQVHKKAPSHYLLSLKKTNQEPPDKDQAPLSHMLDLFPRVNPPSQLTKSQLSKLESDSGMRPWKAGSDPHSSVCSEERLCTQVI